MSHPSDAITKSEFFEMTCLILKEILNPQMLRAAMDTAATKLKLPEGRSILESVLVADTMVAVPEKAVHVKVATDKKEKKPRASSPYNLYVSWISDFAAHYGRHPAIVAVKTANPDMRPGLSFCSEFSKTIPAEKKELMYKTFQDFLSNNAKDAEAEGAGSLLDAFKKYELQHPENSVGRIIGLEARPEFKTDPAQMKAEAAEARRYAAAGGGAAAAGGGGGPQSNGTPLMKLDFNDAHHPNGNGIVEAVLQRQQEEEDEDEESDEEPLPAVAPTPVAAAKSPGKDKEKSKKKRKAEEAAAAGAEDEEAGGDVSTKKKHKKKEGDVGTDGKEAKHKKHKKDKKDKESAPAEDIAVKSEKKSERKSEKKSERKSEKKDKKEKKHKKDRAEEDE